jgi:predicted metal-dependent HD superfamily phosphohydrolase
MDMLQQLQSAWERLFGVFDIKPASSQPLFTDIVAAYSAGERHYHTLEHVQAVLTTIDALSYDAINLPAIQIAAWFHDYVYDPHASDNEERSAVHMMNVLTQIALPLETLQSAQHMIISTRTHHAEIDDIDCSILLDADLAILGAASEQYTAYSQAIRQEYHWVPETTYRSARKHVLQTFLLRERIYCIDEMVKRFEARARENMRQEIMRLSP